MTVSVGSGLDVHAFASEPRPLVLAGVTVPDAPGLAGHSDADVVAHAVADALLGAAALGDLGQRFGADAPELAGADSLELLAEVVAQVTATDGVIVHVDVIVVAQRPRLSDHRDAMRVNLARSLGTDLGAVSVKFTTTDGLGSIGRGEGIACWATVTIQRTGG
ncbi:MAG: 2-C-methyl-D-erythritol 2,4-cyclodiphosphate synthase [Actinobacteria bacterium]|nr:2-C-methyl-D-erythritol 2,4-cyclodiphosphate synthase [Actinomycetota bacterium]